MERLAIKPTGWNTWDYRSYNHFCFLRDGRVEFTVALAVFDERAGRVHERFRWEHLRRLGPHASDGSYIQHAFTTDAGGQFMVESAGGGEQLALRVRARADKRLKVLLKLIPMGEEAPTHVDAKVGRLDYRCWTVRFAGWRWPSDYFVSLPSTYLWAEPAGELLLTVSPPSKPLTISQVRRRIAAAEKRYTSSSLTGAGELADGPQAMMRAITWNTLYDNRRGLICTPVSRNWCIDWHGPLIFGWDSFLVGMMAGAEDAELAAANFETVTAPIKTLGFVPNYVMSHGASSLDRSQPPLGAYTIWKAYCLDENTDRLQRLYPLLCRWQRWWLANRDGNGDGLLEYGSNPTPRYHFPQLLEKNPAIQHAGICANYEAGLDNSPMYDGVKFNKRRNTYELIDVGLNSLYAASEEALAMMAHKLSLRRQARQHRRRYQRLVQLINEQLWDQRRQIYANRHWNGKFSKHLSPTSFFPLLAGAVEPQRARKMVERHLLDEQKFWGRFVVPSISRDDPAYNNNDYWRGRIWGPFNFLLAEGLRRYRMDDIASELAEKSLKLFMKAWRSEQRIYENYNANTGQGGDVPNADPLYHWGGLMVYIAIAELIDCEPLGSITDTDVQQHRPVLRFGTTRRRNTGIRNFLLGGHRYHVQQYAGRMRVLRDGKLFIRTTTPAIVRLAANDRYDPVEITTTGHGKLLLKLPGPGPSPIVKVDNRRVDTKIVADNVLTAVW